MTWFVAGVIALTAAVDAGDLAAERRWKPPPPLSTTSSYAGNPSRRAPPLSPMIDGMGRLVKPRSDPGNPTRRTASVSVGSQGALLAALADDTTIDVMASMVLASTILTAGEATAVAIVGLTGLVINGNGNTLDANRTCRLLFIDASEVNAL